MIQGSCYCAAVKFELLAARSVHQGGMRFAMAHRDQGIRLHDPPAAPSALRAFLRLPGVPHRRKSAERPERTVNLSDLRAYRASAASTIWAESRHSRHPTWRVPIQFHN